MPERKRYASRKFLLAVGFFAGGTIGLVIGNVDGGAYAALAGAVLAFYGGADVAEEYVHMQSMKGVSHEGQKG